MDAERLVTKGGNPITCRGGCCTEIEQPACLSAGRCLYKSSAEEARELREARTTAVTQEVRTKHQHVGCLGCESCEPEQPAILTALPTDSAARKDIPLARGLLDYFPAALARVAELSHIGNEKHNPGQELHWARSKSSDHADCIMRHLADRGKPDPGSRGLSHTVAVAWRALALLQEEEEMKGAPKARGAK